MTTPSKSLTQTILDGTNRLLARFANSIITFYQHTISPDKGIFSTILKGRVCSHIPHCSAYGKECFTRYGFRPGIAFTAQRVLSCTPRMTHTYDPSHYRIVFFSGSPVGVPFLEEIAHDPRFEVVSVVTMPDRESGRGQQMHENVLAEAAKTIYAAYCRAFFLRSSLIDGWEDILAYQGITRFPHETRGGNIYFHTKDYTSYVSILQGLLRDGAWYIDISGASPTVIYPKKVFDISHDSAAAKAYGQSCGIPVEQLDWKEENSYQEIYNHYILKPERISGSQGEAFAAQLRDLQPDYCVVVAYGKIFPQTLLDIPSKGCINVHGSILPAYRGASPLQTVFLDSATTTGLTIQKMSAGMDEGDIIQTYQFPLPFSWTSQDLFAKVQADGPAVLCDALWDFGKGELQAKPQDHAAATYCSKLQKEDGEVDPRALPLNELYPHYRAYAIWPKIRFMGPEQFPRIHGKKCIIESLLLDENLYTSSSTEPLVHGTTLHPAVISLMIKPEGKKAMSWESFVNGYLV